MGTLNIRNPPQKSPKCEAVLKSLLQTILVEISDLSRLCTCADVIQLCLFVVLSLNVIRGSSKELWPLLEFLTVSLLLADLHPDKYSSSLGFKNVRSVSRIWSQNNGIKAPPNERRGN